MTPSSASHAPAGAGQCVDVFVVACGGPGDLSGVQALIDEGRLDPTHIVAVMGKTEGNGCVNDYTREYASAAWAGFLAPHLGCTPAQAESRVALVMSGGTEGVLSPHFTVFTRRPAARASGLGKRLVLGVAQTRDFTAEEVGRQAQVEETAAAVREAMADAGIGDAADVHFVQVKCPLLTSSRIGEAVARGATPVTRDTYESMAYSRGASSLGIALALGEVTPAESWDARVLVDDAAFSARASASSGIELLNNVVIVLGEADGASSPHVIAHAVMQDAIDAGAVRRMLRARFDLDPDKDGAVLSERLVTLLAKSEADPRGTVRGARHTMLNDSDISATRHARAAVGAVLASVAHRTTLYVSGGAEHQGPPGGGPVAAILRAADGTSSGEPS